MRGVGLSSWIKWQGNKLDRPGRPKPIVKKWESLAGELMKMVLNSHLRKRFNHIPEVVGIMKSEWAIVKAAA